MNRNSERKNKSGKNTILVTKHIQQNHCFSKGKPYKYVWYFCIFLQKHEQYQRAWEQTAMIISWGTLHKNIWSPNRDSRTHCRYFKKTAIHKHPRRKWPKKILAILWKISNSYKQRNQKTFIHPYCQDRRNTTRNKK